MGGAGRHDPEPGRGAVRLRPQRLAATARVPSESRRGGCLPWSRKADKLDKMAEYADAGIPFYWFVWLPGDHALSIDVHVLDHPRGYYRLYRTLSPEQETSTIDVPIRIQIDWDRLAH